MLFAVVCTPIVVLLVHFSIETTRENEETKRLELELAFVGRHGLDAKLIEIVRPESLYIYVWEEDGTRHFTLSIDGLFVELGSFEL